MRLIHITDPHLSSLQAFGFMQLSGKRRSGYLSWYKNRRHEHLTEILGQLTQAVAAESPDQILLGGDLVHIGLEEEIIEAAQWLQSLGPPEKVLLVPGNHDNYSSDSWAAIRRYWAAYLPDPESTHSLYSAGYPVRREHLHCRLSGLNSSCVTRIFSAAGELGSDQLTRLAQALHENAGDGRFHCMLIHHPPLPGLTRSRKALRDARALQDILLQHPPDLVLYGHLHHNREHLLGDTRIYCTASASSLHESSYRVFDVQPEEPGWSCHMRLMTRDAGGEKDTPFRLVNSATWSSAPVQA